MNFLHISDTHFLRDYAPVTGVFHDVLMRMTSPLEQLDALIKQVLVPLDFIIFTGDLTDGGDAADYQVLKASLDARFPGLPIFSVPGNHDCEQAWKEGWGQLPSRVDLAHFADLRLILLNSTDPDFPNGKITDADCDQLEQVLSEVGDAPAILLLHHHLIREQFVLSPARFPDRFRSIVERSGILAIFNGHTHHGYEGYFAGKPCFTVGSLSFRGNNRSGEVGFEQFAKMNECTLRSDGLHVRTIQQKGQARELAVLTLPVT